MNTVIDISLLERVREIGPLLKAKVSEGEQLRRLPQKSFNALSDSGLLSMLSPKDFNGLETDPLSYAMVIEEVTKFDSAAAWTLTNPELWAFFCSRLPDQGAIELLGNDPRALFAASITPPMTAKTVEGGFHISGPGRFASNCRHAKWIAASCQVKDDTASSRPIWAYISIDDC